MDTKRTRESASKVRTGCTTCKARRIKCDEGKPVCRRCSIGGRQCDYTAKAVVPRRNVFTIYVPPVQSQPTFFASNAGIDYFHHKVVTGLTGHLSSGFWGRAVLQMAQAEPSIRHAISAASIVHQDVELSLVNPTGYVTANKQAQWEWERAAKCLSARIQSQPDSHLVPLVCALLFAFIELMRGNKPMCMLHVESGLNILAAHKRNSAGGSPTTNSNENVIEEIILPVFSRLNVLCTLAARETPPVYDVLAEDTEEYDDLAEAELRLVALLDICLRFTGQANDKSLRFEIEIDDCIEQAKLLGRLDAWRRKLDELLVRLKIAGKPVKAVTHHLLMLHYKVITIWLQVSTTPGEMGADAFDKEFGEIMTHAEAALLPLAASGKEKGKEKEKETKGGKKPQPPLVSFDIQILGPLFYVALKCREPSIRRRALALLQHVPRREGLWNAHFAFATAKRVIELEEADMDERGRPKETARIYGLPLPDDESYVQGLGEVALNLRQKGHNIVLSPAYPGTLEVQFLTRPWGLTGDWHTVKEYIKPYAPGGTVEETRQEAAKEITFV